jgi:hypothetical protein
MKFSTSILLLLCVCLKNFCIAQQDTSTISKIISAEYFFDKDPGIGKGIKLNVGTSDTTVSFTDSASVLLLQPGYHNLSIRVKNAAKKWSIFLTKTFFIGNKNIVEPTIAKITAAEYFIDEDPGTGKGTSMKIGKADTVISFTDSVSPLLAHRAGRNTIRARVKNADGKWSEFLSDTFSISFSALDDDRDGLIVWQELQLGTDTANFDTNNDGLADGVNVFTGLNPLGNDTDSDGISNKQEILNGTSPILSDTDGDGVPDNLDAFPLDPHRTKLPPKNLSDHTPPVITLNEPPL